MNKFRTISNLVVFSLVCVVSLSCNKDAAEIESTNAEQAFIEPLTGEAGAVKAVNDFMAMINENEPAGTRSAISTRVGMISKKSVFDYTSSSGAQTRSAEDDVAVYEIILENGDDSQGYAVVVDEENPTLVAFAEKGAIADTTSNPGLAFWFREMAKAYSFKPETSTRGSYFMYDDLFEDTIEDPAYYVDHSWASREFVRNEATLSVRDDRYLFPPQISDIYLYSKAWAKNQWTQAGAPVRWAQFYPYNMAISAMTINGKKASLGCFGPAAAAIICFHRYFPNYDPNWAGFQQYTFLGFDPPISTFNPPMSLIVEGAYLCKLITEDSGAVVWDPYTGAGNTDASRTLNAFRNSFNYHINMIQGWDPSIVYQEITSKKRPILIGASHFDWNTGINAGHIWVIDGLFRGLAYRYYTEMTTKVVSGTTRYSYDTYRHNASIDMYHMIWGYGDNSSGWYASFTPWTKPYYSFSSDVHIFNEIYPNI